MKINKFEKMSNNDVLRRLRYALDIKNQTMVKIFKNSDHNITVDELNGLLKREGEEGFKKCSDKLMTLFLDGFIIEKRGLLDDSKKPVQVEEKLDNNLILKKLRIALSLRGEDFLAIMKLDNPKISSSEVSAIFRKKGHRNYKKCGDKFVRNFLKGLTIKYRD